MTERVVQSQSKDSQLDSISSELLGQALQCVTTKGEFHLAMSCASSLDDLYARLMYDPDLRAMPWNKTHLSFFGSAACSKAAGDSICRALIAHSGILEEHVHFFSVPPSPLSASIVGTKCSCLPFTLP